MGVRRLHRRGALQPREAHEGLSRPRDRVLPGGRRGLDERRGRRRVRASRGRRLRARGARRAPAHAARREAPRGPSLRRPRALAQAARLPSPNGISRACREHRSSRGARGGDVLRERVRRGRGPHARPRGDFLSTTLGIGRGSRFQTLREVRFPDSLGLLYSAITSYLGFDVNDAEDKVMGLAPYGKPRYVHRLPRHHAARGRRPLPRSTSSWLSATARLDYGMATTAARSRRAICAARRAASARARPPGRAHGARHQDLACVDAGDHFEEVGTSTSPGPPAPRSTGLDGTVASRSGSRSTRSLNGKVLLSETPFERLLLRAPGRRRTGHRPTAPPCTCAPSQLGAPRGEAVDGNRAAVLRRRVLERRLQGVLAGRELPFREVADPARRAAATSPPARSSAEFQGRIECRPAGARRALILAAPGAGRHEGHAERRGQAP